MPESIGHPEQSSESEREQSRAGDTPDDPVWIEVSSGLEEAKAFAESLSLDAVTNGQWFLILLQRVLGAYDRNARAEYFQRKYPGLRPDEIADILISVTVRYATIAGALTGMAATANMIATLSSAGMTAILMAIAVGGEMLYLARIQLRLVLDLSVVYDVQLDLEDPEDILAIFGYAMGIAPAEVLGTRLVQAAAGGTRYAVKKYVSKGTLKAMQDFSRRLGIRILQRTIIAYAVPIASAAVGSGYNYVATQAVGRIARSHLKNRGKVTDELRALVSRQNTYDIAFPVAVMYMAKVDGRYASKENELYRALLSRMSFDDYTQAEFRKLLASEDNVLAAMAEIEDDDMRRSLVEALALMAIYDGELAGKERAFLASTAQRLNVPLDLDDVEQRALDYRMTVEENFLRRTAGVAGDAARKAVDIAGQMAGGVKDASSATGRGATRGLAKLHRVLTDLTQEPRVEVALPLAIKDLVRLKLAEAQERRKAFEQRYGMDFHSFRRAWDAGRIAERHSYQVERDYQEWDAAMTDEERLREMAEMVL